MSRTSQVIHPGFDTGASDMAAGRRHWPAPSPRVQVLVVLLALALLAALTFAH